MKIFNIASAAKLTGLTPFVIRAWEKRYNVVQPGRTDTNRRLYTEEDIQKLKLLKSIVDKGNSIKNIAGLTIEALNEMLSSYEDHEQIKQGTRESSTASYLEQCIDAVSNYDGRALESSLMRASIELSPVLLIENIILPLLKEIGQCWSQGIFHVAQEHMASVVIRTFLFNLKDSFKKPEHGSKILITTPVGQQHEFGALIASIIASIEGWESIYLGPDLPSSELILAAEKIRPQAVAISIVYSTEREQLYRELEKLKYLPEGIALLAGGPASYQYKSVIENLNGTIIPDMHTLRNHLRFLNQK